MLLGEVIHYIIGFIRLPESNFCYMTRMRADGEELASGCKQYRKRTEITQTYYILHFRPLMQEVLCVLPISLALIPNTSIITDASARCLVQQRCSINIWMNEGITSQWVCSSRFGPLQPMCRQPAAFLMIHLQPQFDLQSLKIFHDTMLLIGSSPTYLAWNTRSFMISCSLSPS